jgi:hypothetical protein
LEKKQWKPITRKEASLLTSMSQKFNYNTAENFNEKLIGFLTPNNRKRIIFKLKSVEPGKKEKGQQCPSKGENKSVILDRVNYLTKQLHKEKTDAIADKYSMDKKNKNRQSESIYGLLSEETKQYYQKPGSKRKKVVLMTDVQLCVETEFLLRYLDEKDNDKKWFFTTLEDALSNISQKRNVSETKVNI